MKLIKNISGAIKISGFSQWSISPVFPCNQERNSVVWFVTLQGQSKESKQFKQRRWRCWMFHSTLYWLFGEVRMIKFDSWNFFFFFPFGTQLWLADSNICVRMCVAVETKWHIVTLWLRGQFSARGSKSSGRTFGIGLQLSIDSIAEELLKLPPWKKWSKPETKGREGGAQLKWSVMKEKSEREGGGGGVGAVFSLTECEGRKCVCKCVCVFVLSYFGTENKICLAWSLHLSWRNNTNSISPCRVIRNVIYWFCVQTCMLGNYFVVPQQRWHTGLSLHSRRHHSPFQCVPTLVKSMLASMAIMEMCSLTEHITQWVWGVPQCS